MLHSRHSVIFQYSVNPRFLHSFPTRRSSDLGIYDFQWQLYQQGVGPFGQTSTSVRITVGDPGPPPDPPSIGGLSSLEAVDRKSTRLNSSHRCISYAVFCLKKKTVLSNIAIAK